MMSFRAGEGNTAHRIIIHDAWEHASLDQRAMVAWLSEHYPERSVEITHEIAGGLHLIIHMDGPVTEAETIATHFFLRWR